MTDDQRLSHLKFWQSVNSQNIEILLEGREEHIETTVLKFPPVELNGDSEAKCSWFVGTEDTPFSGTSDTVDRGLLFF